MNKDKISKHRCPACGDPSARPVHPGCRERLDRRAVKAAEAASKKEAKKESSEASR